MALFLDRNLNYVNKASKNKENNHDEQEPDETESICLNIPKRELSPTLHH